MTGCPPEEVSQLLMEYGWKYDDLYVYPAPIKDHNGLYRDRARVEIDELANYVSFLENI